VSAKTLYQVLGVSEDASEGEIKSAFKRLAKKYHPDVAPIEKINAAEMFKEIAEAYAILSNSAQRLLYDQSLKYGGFRAVPRISYEWIYLSYLDSYGWSVSHRKVWNEHHDVMYG
jgi:curved DNA-binding protein CbpA